MLKKFFTSIGVLALICFSFYYTDTAVDIVKRNDPIMKEIQSVSNFYYKESIDATLIEEGIIPGVSGTQINIDKSYEKMKKYGSFEKSLLVFEEVIPNITTSKTYDKYVISGNLTIQKVSLIFKIDDTIYIDEILEVLKDKNAKATFFMTSEIIKNDINILEKVYLTGNSIELLSSDYSGNDINTANKVLKNLINEKVKYCYSEIKDNSILSSCKNYKMHSIIPNIMTTNFPYNQIKNNVTSGSMISLSNNINTLRELSSIINYLNQKGYKLVTLEELLDE